MKKTVLVLLMTVLALTAFSAGIMLPKTYIYETTSDDSIRWMEDTGSSLLLAGFSNSKEGHGSNDFLLMNVTYEGSVIWQKYYGGSSDDRGYVVKKVEDGLIYGGAMLSQNYDDLKNNGGWDALLLKLNDSGDIQWKMNYGRKGSETIRDVIETNDDCYIFCGYTFSEDFEDHHGGKDFWVVKVDDKGEIIWERVMGGSNYDMPYSIVETKDGGYVVAGYSFSKNGDLAGMENHGGGDFWIVKFDYFGNVLWSKLYGGSSWEEVRQMKETRDRGFILAGVGSSPDGDIEEGHGHWDAWLVKLDSTGNLQWEQAYGGSSYDKVFSVYELRDRGFIAAGMTKSDDGDVEELNGKSDVWIIRTDRYGTLIWEDVIGGEESESAEYILKRKDGQFVVAWGEFEGSESFAGDNGRRYKDFQITVFTAN